MSATPVPNLVKPLYWRARYARWPAKVPAAARDGYTVLVPVPGDMPVLLDIALTVIRTLNHAHRLETIVIPDMRSAAAQRIVESHRDRWPGSLRLVDLARAEQMLLPRLKNPGKNHPAQLIRGTTATDSSHVIFHDADLFPCDPDLHERTWAACVDPAVDVCGVDEAWDPWFARHGRDLVATWEMCCRTEWMRRFAPWRHFAHEAASSFGPHVFDTTFWAQFMTAQSRLTRIESPDQIIHFNYMISTYRNFQRASEPFHDRNFRLLLLRLLHDAFDSLHSALEIPSLADLERGLNDPTARVYYVADDAPRFLAMVDKLRGILAGPWIGVDVAAISNRLTAFARWAEGASQSPPTTP